MSVSGADTSSRNWSAQDPILTYTRRPGEEMVSAVVAAFSRDPLDVTADEQDPLHEWLDLDAIENLFASARDDVRVSTVVWDYHVVLTPETIEVYEPAATTD